MTLQLGLLIFTKNELIEDLITASAPFTKEILVIDFNSSEETFEINEKIILKYGGKILKLIDLGYIEIYRTFAFNIMNSEFILNLDPDEIPSSKFLSNLQSLVEADIYYVPRKVTGTENVEYVPRIFKKESVIWKGYLHERPISKNHRVIYLPETHFIEHSINEENWDFEKSRSRLFRIESCIRPPIVHSFVNTYNLKIPSLLKKVFSMKMLGRIHNQTLLKVVLSFLLVRDKIKSPSSFHFSKFYYLYNIRKIKCFKKLNKTVRNQFIKSYFEIYEVGGPIKYLGIDLPNYVVDISSYNFNIDNVSLLQALILFRLNNGRIFDPKYDFLEEKTIVY